MARIAGVNIPTQKRVEIALTYIHGIGLSTAKKLVINANISSDRRTDDLTTEETIALRENLESLDLKLD